QGRAQFSPARNPRGPGLSRIALLRRHRRPGKIREPTGREGQAPPLRPEDDPAPSPDMIAVVLGERQLADVVPYNARRMAKAIECRGLVKRYGPVTAVDGLDLAIPPG